LLYPKSFKALRSKTRSSALACGSKDVGFLLSIPRVPSAAADFTLGYALVAPPALSIIVLQNFKPVNACSNPFGLQQL
jgi:hypothetical protein